MARTAEMRLIELMVLKQDISAVIEYIGKKESFQFQDSERDRPKDKKIHKFPSESTINTPSLVK